MFMIARQIAEPNEVNLINCYEFFTGYVDQEGTTQRKPDFQTATVVSFRGPEVCYRGTVFTNSWTASRQLMNVQKALDACGDNNVVAVIDINKLEDDFNRLEMKRGMHFVQQRVLEEIQKTQGN